MTLRIEPARLTTSHRPLVAVLLVCLVPWCLLGCTAERPGPLTDAHLRSASAQPLAMTPDGATVWIVNPDADSVTPFDVATLTAGQPVAVGREPWGVAVSPQGVVVVLNRGDGSLSLLSDGVRTDVPVGPEPGGVVFGQAGRVAYVTVSSADEVAVVDVVHRHVVERISVGRMPWSVAVQTQPDGGDRVIVAHRLARLRSDGAEARDDGKEAWLTVIESDGHHHEVVIAPYAFGFPNVLEGMAIQGDTLLVAHLLNRPEAPRDFQNTVSAALSSVDVMHRSELVERRLHVNDGAFSTPVNYPRAVAVTPDGQRAYLALAGTDAVMGVDLSDPTAPRLLGFWEVGSNPRGIVLNQDASRAFVMNYLGRSVSVLDLVDLRRRREVARVSLVEETLAPDMLRGKQLFNNANDPRLSHLGWMSCASCHPDGGVDGTTWITPEGHRQTMPLWNLEGTAPFHASGTRDEIHDVEVDIEQLMQGIGLAPGVASRPLGAPNKGRSADLDALAAFVLRGIRVPRAPDVDAQQATRGRATYLRLGCHTCHGGDAWTTSHLPGPPGTLAPDGALEVVAVLHDVGTFDSSREGLGANGFDVPTLLGVHATAPYFHDGSATRLADVVTHPVHGDPTLSPSDVLDIVAFLESIDAYTEPVPLDPR